MTGAAKNGPPSRYDIGLQGIRGNLIDGLAVLAGAPNLTDKERLKILNNVCRSSVVSPEFLEQIATDNSHELRVMAARSLNTHEQYLSWLLFDDSAPIAFTAFDNPSTPIISVLLKEHLLMPDIPVNSCVTVVKRKQEFNELVESFNAELKDIMGLPLDWFMKTFILPAGVDNVKGLINQSVDRRLV